MQLGLAAVTEANYGDILVKLKSKRSRGIDEVISEVRAKVKVQEPVMDTEFTQTLQDMISDLTGEPQPVEIKLFSQDAALLAQWAPKVADSIAEVKDKDGKTTAGISGVVDVLNSTTPSAARPSCFK
jgi:multidrug efflux pump subunit AcrB